jgi:hypothetical protein
MPTSYEKELIKCIAIVTFLNTMENIILGNGGVPEYDDFKIEAWQDYLANQRRTVTNDF